MRVLYLNLDRGIPVLGDKGGSVHVRSVVTALTRLGHDVTLLCSRAGSGNAPPPGRLIELPVAVTPEDLLAEAMRLGLFPAALDDPQTRREVTLLAHDHALPRRIEAALAAADMRPDLVYERHALFHIAGIAVAALLGVPRILEVNAPLAVEQERYRGLVLRDLAVAREESSWRAADLAVAVSQDMHRHLRAASVAERQILVAPNGVDTALFRPDPQAGARVRRSHRLGDDPVIGFVGSFKAWHGVEMLIETICRLRGNWQRLRLLAVGAGPLLAAAQERAAALGLAEAAVFTGAVPHDAVPAYLAATDFTVAPYPGRDGFYFSPLKIVESLAAGRAVVAPAIGQITALIEHGTTGLLYPPGDATACEDAIRRLLTEPQLCARLGAQAAQRAQAAWDWTAVIGNVTAHPAARRPPVADAAA